MRIERTAYDYKCDFCKQYIAKENGIGFDATDDNIVIGEGQRVRWNEAEIEKASNHICQTCLNNLVDLARRVANQEKIHFNIKVIDYSF